MKPERMRVKIAEGCGIVIEPCSCTGNPFRDAKTRKHIPDYLADLNAMHEAEKTLTDVQAFTYRQTLATLAVKHQGAAEIFGSSGYDYFAPAAQRAEAFLKTLGLWDDDAEGGS